MAKSTTSSALAASVKKPPAACSTYAPGTRCRDEQRHHPPATLRRPWHQRIDRAAARARRATIHSGRRSCQAVRSGRVQAVAEGQSTMSIWQDKNGRRHVGIMCGGRRVHRILAPGASAGDAKRVEAELRAALALRRQVAIPGDPPMTAVLALYEQHARHLRSADTSMHHARRLGPWAERYRASQAREFAAHVVHDMTGHYAPATINRSLATVKKGLTLAWEQGLTPDNWGLRIKALPARNMRDVVLSIDQIKALADAASDAVRAAIWIALYTGCRRGEILALRPGDIGRSELTIRAGNTKTLRTRTIPIVAPLRPWLRQVPIGINYEGLKSGFRRAREAAGLPWATFHDLRRSCGTMMIQAGVDLYVVSRVLGHSSVTVTQQRYAHLQIERVRDEMRKTFG